MRFIFLLAIIVFSSCESKQDKLVNRQQAIQQEMEQVKAAYFKTTDSLDGIKETDTTTARLHEIAAALTAADSKKNVLLIPLQKEYDSLTVELQQQ